MVFFKWSVNHSITVLQHFVVLLSIISQSFLLSRLNSHTNISTFPASFFLAFIFVKLPVHPSQHMSQTWTISINMGRISMTLILRQTWQKEINAFPQAWKSAQYPCQSPGCLCVWHGFHPLNYRLSDICYPFYYILEPSHLLAFVSPKQSQEFVLMYVCFPILIFTA